MKTLMLACAALTACSAKTATVRPQQPLPMTGSVEYAMTACPVAIEGTSTYLRKTAVGVDVIVISETPATRAEIRRMADLHLQPHAAPRLGTGALGHCPIIHSGTRILRSEFTQGVVLHVQAIAPEHVSSLQDQTSERLFAMPPHAIRAARR